MIKCDGFGKFLKQGFFTLLISCFILLGGSFVNAGYSGHIGQSYRSPYDSNFEILVNGKGNLLTKYFGYGKRIFMIDDGTYFFRSTSGLPYGSVFGNGQTQGYYDTYLLCDPFTFGGPTNCQKYSIDTGENSTRKRILSSLNNGGSYYFDYTSCGGANPYYSFDICFYSSEYDKNLCFFVGKNSNNNAISCATSLAYYYPNGNTSFFSNVSNSQNYSSGFDHLDPSIFGLSPGDTNPGVVGPDGSFDVGDGSVDITGDFIYSSCTNGDIILNLESKGYNNYMCYGGLFDYSSFDTGVVYDPIPGSGLNINDIYKFDDLFSSDIAWFNYFNSLYQRTLNNDYYLNKWVNYPAVYKTWFDFFYQFGGNGFIGDFNVLRQYCYLKTSSDFYMVYDGSYFSQLCTQIISDRSNNFGSSGLYVDGVNWGYSSGEDVVTSPVEFIQNFFNKIQEAIPTNYDDLGVSYLPIYIITFLLALIFFRFLMH